MKYYLYFTYEFIIYQMRMRLLPAVSRPFNFRHVLTQVGTLIYIEWITHLITNPYKKVKPEVNLQIAA